MFRSPAGAPLNLAAQALGAFAAACLVALSGTPLSASPIIFTGNPSTDFAAPSTVTSQVLLNPAMVQNGAYNPGGDPSSTYVSNFGTPSNLTDYNPYTIYTNSDQTNFYVGLQTVGPLNVGNLDFANLYFSTNLPNGSTVGFEVNNSRAFIPGVAGYSPYNASSGIVLDDSSTATQGMIEFSVPWSFFTTDPLAMGFPLATTDVELRLSQAFGYSVAGGASYGVTSPFDPDTTTRFGDFAVPTPEPSTLTLAISAAFTCLIPIARRKLQGALAP